MNRVSILQGDVLSRLAELGDGTVHCCVTSTPYWGLRSYNTPPQIWGGDSSCRHEWGPGGGGLLHENWNFKRGTQEEVSGSGPLVKVKEERKGGDSFCRVCGAWRGDLGLEPIIELFVEHLVMIFREVRRVLRPEGTCWLNIGDSFCGSGEGGGGNRKGNEHGQHDIMKGKRPRVSKGIRGGSPKRSGGVCEDQPNRYPQVNLKAKDLCLIPARVALALQLDGWWIRQDIIWSKRNNMPESCRDRPTTAHEHLFLLAKSPIYFYDNEAVKEKCKSGPSDIKKVRESKERIGGFYKDAADPLMAASSKTNIGKKRSVGSPSGRNLRSVWDIPTSPLSCGLCVVCGEYWHSRAPHEHCGQETVGHFAAFPQRLVEKCIKAGTSEVGVCPTCGAPWRRVVEKPNMKDRPTRKEAKADGQRISFGFDGYPQSAGQAYQDWRDANPDITTGWQPTCKCPHTEADLIPATVLDPFFGSGTSGDVAAKMGRDCIGIELKSEYVTMSAKRIRKDLGMLATVEISPSPLPHDPPTNAPEAFPRTIPLSSG